MFRIIVPSMIIKCLSKEQLGEMEGGGEEGGGEEGRGEERGGEQRGVEEEDGGSTKCACLLPLWSLLAIHVLQKSRGLFIASLID